MSIDVPLLLPEFPDPVPELSFLY